MDSSGTGVKLVVVTGTGNCGTASAAQHFGIGHEQVFTPFKPPEAFNLPDSSWLAAPYIGRIELPVIHLVRNPLDVVKSLVGGSLFDDQRRDEAGAYRLFVEKWCPQAFAVTDPTRRSCIFYVAWNRMIGGEPVRIEDLTDIRLNQRPRADLTWDDIPELEQIGAAYGYL